MAGLRAAVDNTCPGPEEDSLVVAVGIEGIGPVVAGPILVACSSLALDLEAGLAGMELETAKGVGMGPRHGGLAGGKREEGEVVDSGEEKAVSLFF